MRTREKFLLLFAVALGAMLALVMHYAKSANASDKLKDRREIVVKEGWCKPNSKHICKRNSYEEYPGIWCERTIINN